MESGSVALRPILVGDLDRLRQHRNDPGTRLWLGNADCVTEPDQRRWFATLGTAADRAYRIAALEGEDIGLVRITNLPGGEGPRTSRWCATVGSDVFREHRGKGYGHLVFDAACELAIRLCHPAALDLWVFRDNHAAVRVYEKAGFRYDLNTPVQWMLRPRGDGYHTLAYVRMCKEVE